MAEEGEAVSRKLGALGDAAASEVGVGAAEVLRVQERQAVLHRNPLLLFLRVAARQNKC